MGLFHWPHHKEQRLLHSLICNQNISLWYSQNFSIYSFWIPLLLRKFVEDPSVRIPLLSVFHLSLWSMSLFFFNFILPSLSWLDFHRWGTGFRCLCRHMTFVPAEDIMGWLTQQSHPLPSCLPSRYIDTECGRLRSNTSEKLCCGSMCDVQATEQATEQVLQLRGSTGGGGCAREPHFPGKHIEQAFLSTRMRDFPSSSIINAK